MNKKRMWYTGGEIFSQLTALANGDIDDVPKMLREVDTVTFQIFLELVEQMKILIARARD